MNRRIDILIKMAICYIEKKDYIDALRSSEAALAMNDQNYRALQYVAWCEFLLERHSQALEHINKAISLKESDGDGYYIKGRILMATEKYPEAGKSFKRAILHNHNKVAYLGSSGILNALTKSYKEAFDDFRKATDIDASVPEMWFNIGMLYEFNHQYNEAIIAYKKTIEADSSFNQAIVRQQALSSEGPIKPPHPQFIHSEFRIYDPMVPTKSYLNNQKVKKAIEPCFNPEFAVHPSNLIKTIFNNIDRVSTELPLNNAVPGEETKNLEKLPNHPVEEVKKDVGKKVECSQKAEALLEKESKHKPLSEQAIPKIPIPESNYVGHQYYMPSMHPMGNAIPQAQPKQPVVPLEISGPQYITSTLQPQMQPQPPFQNLQPPNSIPTTLFNNIHPSLSNLSFQQLEFLSQLAQFQQQNSLQALLNSLTILSQPTNPYFHVMPSYMQPSMPTAMPSTKPSYNQPPFNGNLMMTMTRPMQPMPTNDLQFQYNQYLTGISRPPNIQMYNPTPLTHKPENSSMNYMIPNVGYGAAEEPQYSQKQPSVAKPLEASHLTTTVSTRPAPRHSKPIRPIPRTILVEKSPTGLEDLIKATAGGDGKGIAPQKSNAQGEEEKLGDPNTMIKFNTSSNKVEENHIGKRKRPEGDMNKEITTERERHNIQTRRHKP